MTCISCNGTGNVYVLTAEVRYDDPAGFDDYRREDCPSCSDSIDDGGDDG